MDLFGVLFDFACFFSGYSITITISILYECGSTFIISNVNLFANYVDLKPIDLMSLRWKIQRKSIL